MNFHSSNAMQQREIFPSFLSFCVKTIKVLQLQAVKDSNVDFFLYYSRKNASKFCFMKKDVESRTERKIGKEFLEIEFSQWNMASIFFNSEFEFRIVFQYFFRFFLLYLTSLNYVKGMKFVMKYEFRWKNFFLFHKTSILSRCNGKNGEKSLKNNQKVEIFHVRFSWILKIVAKIAD